MKPLALILSLLALAACGVDGEPVQPTATAAILVTPGAVSGGLGVGLTRGPVSVQVSL